MATRLATPGVYIEEKNAFPNSVAAVPTAVPAFIGYTEKTVKNGQSLINRPVRITSLTEFNDTFGGKFTLSLILKKPMGVNLMCKLVGRIFRLYLVQGPRFMLL